MPLPPEYWRHDSEGCGTKPCINALGISGPGRGKSTGGTASCPSLPPPHLTCTRA